MTNTLVNATNLTKNAESDYSTEGNMPVMQSQLMSIDMANAAFIMESLTNLYSDPYLSVVREYVANAIDAHVEAGNPDPVEVSMPSQWSPNLVIKDQGIGMSQADVFRYGTYGSSDKRDNLDLVGNFGMGSKSALAITNSFTITAIKDGEYTMASIGRNDEGFGQVDIITSEPTTEPNGVTITIPITSSNIWVVRNRVEKVLTYLPAGRVDVDGTVNTDMRTDLTKISDDIHVDTIDITESSFRYNSIIVISGGFGYKVDWDVTNEIADTVDFDLFGVPDTIYIDVPTGSVDLTPSREQLRMTARTKALITQAVQSTLREITTIYTKKLEDVKTFEDVFSLISELGAKKVTETVINKCTNLVVPESANLITHSIINGQGEYTSRNTSKLNWYLAELISRSDNSKVIILEKDKDYSEKSASSRIKSFLNKVSDTYASYTPVFVLNPAFTDDPQVSEDTLYRYITRTGVHMKLSEIYAEVNEYNKANRTYSGGSNATGQGDDAIIDTTAFDGETFKSTGHYPATGNMKKYFEELFDNKLPTVYVLNDTLSSGMAINENIVRALMSIRGLKTSSASSANFVLIRGGNRKGAYFAKRGIDVSTVSEYFQKNKADIVSQGALDILKEIAHFSSNDEMGWYVGRTIQRFRNSYPSTSATMDIIVDELSSTLGEDAEKISNYVSGHHGVRQFLAVVKIRLNDVEEVTEFIEDLDNHTEAMDRGELVTSVLDSCTALHRYGHTQESYDMLETLAELLTKKEED